MRETSGVQITDLTTRPEFAATIADRGWHAWRKDSAVTLEAYRSGVERMTARLGIPIALVAHRDGRYLGSVLLIDNDLDARPAYSPWIAALWVEPAFRRRGVGRSLVAAAIEEAGRHGCRVCYLGATEANTPYYLAMGFGLIEPAVSGVNILTVDASGRRRDCD